jgi:Fe-S oxidoreductase
VVIEPGCHSVFRDELLKLFPGNARAAALSKLAVGFAEYLQQRNWQPPAGAARQRALLHGHCHQKALSGIDAEGAMLRAAGFEVEAPDTGCCGMAGAFGMKPAFYAASRAIGEAVLLPKVRSAGSRTLVVANGFSCREQIEQLGGRETLHLAEVLAQGLPQ